jgi:hypothetical protein
VIIRSRIIESTPYLAAESKTCKQPILKTANRKKEFRDSFSHQIPPKSSLPRSLLISSSHRTLNFSDKHIQHLIQTEMSYLFYSKLTHALFNTLIFTFNPLNAELNSICHLLILLGDLTFMGKCIVSVSNKIQRYTVYLYLETALHVSGGTSTHHQEPPNSAHTASIPPYNQSNNTR